MFVVAPVVICVCVTPVVITCLLLPLLLYMFVVAPVVILVIGVCCAVSCGGVCTVLPQEGGEDGAVGS